MSGRKLFVVLVLLAVLMASLSGCIINQTVAAHQVGIVMEDGVSIKQIVGPGRYNWGGWWTGMVVIDCSAKTANWSDPDLVTNDTQPIGISVTVTYRRSPESDSITTLWTTYRSEAEDDAALERQVLSRIPAVAKQTTARYTLDQMIGTEEISGTSSTGAAGREVVTEEMYNLLNKQLKEFGAQLLDIRISNIDPGQAYLDLLRQKAQANLGVEVAAAITKQLTEQLNQERQQTAIELERARRQNQVAAELAKVYELSPAALELKRLELMANIFGDKSTIYFLPLGTDLNLILGMDGSVPAVIPAAAP